MRAQALADIIPLDRVDLEVLDRFPMSDRSPPDSTMLSDLDGFLTGIVIGPELVLPSEWTRVIWGGEAPEFADAAEAKAVLGAIMSRYNEIIRQIAADTFAPIFWNRDGTVIAADWAEGCLQAIICARTPGVLRSNRSETATFCFRSLRFAVTNTARLCSAYRRTRKIALWQR
jgi:Uncharacterised protein family (UPF0149)